MAFADTLGAIGTVLNLPAGKRTTTTDSSTKFIAAAKVDTVVSGESVGPCTAAARRWCGKPRSATPKAACVRWSRRPSWCSTALERMEAWPALGGAAHTTPPRVCPSRLKPKVCPLQPDRVAPRASARADALAAVAAGGAGTVTLMAPAEAACRGAGDDEPALRAEGLIVAGATRHFRCSAWTAILRRGDRTCRHALLGHADLGRAYQRLRRRSNGHPARLWIARRAPNKATDPNRLDNLVGGGVPAGQSPHDTVVREGWEKAGLRPRRCRRPAARPRAALAARHPRGAAARVDPRLRPRAAAGLTPRNQDGEVAELSLLRVAARAGAGRQRAR